MRGQNICFHGDRKIFSELSSGDLLTYCSVKYVHKQNSGDFKPFKSTRKADDKIYICRI